jgi:hypothetical protein
MDIREDFNWDASKGRRKLAADKLELLRGEHLKALQATIRSLVKPETAPEVIAWANTARNLLRQIVQTVCIAYSRGCQRTLAGASPVAAAAFADVLIESKIGALANLINQYGWLLGPSFVIPQVEADGSFFLDLIPPSRAEVKLQNPATVADLLYQRPDGLFVRLDGEGWSYYDSEGERAKGLAPIPHGLGYAPVSVFRSEHWAEDWWNAISHRALVDAGLHVAAMQALMDWKLKNSGKQLAIVAPMETLGGKQIVGHPERPLYFDGESGQISITQLDMQQNAAAALDSINATIAAVCDLYGIPPSVLSGVNNVQDWGQVGLARAPEVLDALRDKQIPWMRDGEMQLWPAVCDLLRNSIHKHAGALPPGDEVRDMLRLRFLEPVPDAKRRIARLDLFEREEKLGLACVTDLVMEDRPELTQEQAEQIIGDNLSAYLTRNDALAARNIPAGTGAAIESVAQAQGRTGGLTRAANEAPADDENAADNAA